MQCGRDKHVREAAHVRHVNARTVAGQASNVTSAGATFRSRPISWLPRRTIRKGPTSLTDQRPRPLNRTAANSTFTTDHTRHPDVNTDVSTHWTIFPADPPNSPASRSRRIVPPRQ
jgi:hypothetical protein